MRFATTDIRRRRKAPLVVRELPNAEVAFHPIELSIVGERRRFRGRVFSWLATADGIDAVLGDAFLSANQRKRRFIS